MSVRGRHGWLIEEKYRHVGGVLWTAAHLQVILILLGEGGREGSRFVYFD